MKLQVLQENFAHAVNIASRFASNKAQLPVLSNLHLKTIKNKLLVNATNLEISISLAIGAQVKEVGEITAPARALTEIISNLVQKPVNLEVDHEQLRITAENFSSNLAGMNASDFPAVVTNLTKEVIEFPRDEFLESISKVLFSVSIDESRPTITGILFIFEPGKLTLVSTDGFRLSQKKISLAGNKKSFRLIIPKTILSELTRLSEDSESISFSFNKEDNQVVFGLSSIVVASRIIEGEFPPFEKIIPKDSSFVVDVDREELFRAVKLASVFARDSANVINLNFKTKGIEIAAESKAAGSQKSFVDAKIEGLPAQADEIGKSEIAFNYRFLEELLGNIKDESVRMEFSGANAPGVFRDLKDKDFLHLIMPVKIQS